MKHTARRLVEALGEPNDDTGYPGSERPEDEAGTIENETHFNAEERMTVTLGGLLEEQGCRVRSYEDAGVMTRNNGLVVQHPEFGNFQITVVEDRRR